MHSYHSKKRCRRSGFTLIEIIITVALLISAAALSIPFMSDVLSRNELDVAAEGAVDYLEEARSSSLNGKGGGEFGVHFETDKYILFVGSSYVEGHDDNLVHQLPGLVSISNISIDGGGSDIIFASVSGEPNQVGSIEFTDSSGQIKTVTVNEAGTVDF